MVVPLSMLGRDLKGDHRAIPQSSSSPFHLISFLFIPLSSLPQSACAVVAGLLHFFFLAAFCWMCLEGVQLFRMVVLVFNTTFRPLYMMAGGYGVPAVIVAISALANAKGYGTERQ